MSLTTKSIDFVVAKVPQLVVNTKVTKSTGSLFPTTSSSVTSEALSSVVPSSTQANHVVQHGLDEIVVDARRLQGGGFITHEGARISHPAPVRPAYPYDPHCIVQNNVFYYRNYFWSGWKSCGKT